MTINPRGKVRPCCMFDNKDLDYTIEETAKWQAHFADLYERSLSDEWMPECRECMHEERDTGKSLRVHSLEDYDNLETQGLKYWDLKISNTCNLMCRMCSPNDSSTWYQAAKNNPVEWAQHITDSMSDKLTWHDTHLPYVKEQLYDADVVKFTGGEPMLVKHVKQVIQHLIDTETSYGVSLRLTTNATVEYDAWWQSLTKYFKEVRISMSIDGYGKRFEYQRAGAKWEDVKRNALIVRDQQEHNNFFCNISYTPTAINAAITDKTREWAKSEDIFFHHGVEVYNPKYMSYASLDEKLRSRYNVNSDTPFDPAQLQKLKTQMSYIDKIYGTDFKTECPEFFE